jgi:hypothetical protein
LNAAGISGVKMVRMITDDYVILVRVTPCSDAGGPSNLYAVEIGSIYLPEDADKRKRALDCCGWINDADKATRGQLVEAMMAYHGQEIDRTTVIRIGKPEDGRNDGWNPAPDVVLRSNASLERYVRNNFLD